MQDAHTHTDQPPHLVCVEEDLLLVKAKRLKVERAVTLGRRRVHHLAVAAHAPCATPPPPPPPPTQRRARGAPGGSRLWRPTARPTLPPCSALQLRRLCLRQPARGKHAVPRFTAPGPLCVARALLGVRREPEVRANAPPPPPWRRTDELERAPLERRDLLLDVGGEPLRRLAILALVVRVPARWEVMIDWWESQSASVWNARPGRRRRRVAREARQETDCVASVAAGRASR